MDPGPPPFPGYVWLPPPHHAPILEVNVYRYAPPGGRVLWRSGVGDRGTTSQTTSLQNTIFPSGTFLTYAYVQLYMTPPSFV
jgi:hypothetical protein